MLNLEGKGRPTLIKHRAEAGTRHCDVIHETDQLLTLWPTTQRYICSLKTVKTGACSELLSTIPCFLFTITNIINNSLRSGIGNMYPHLLFI